MDQISETESSTDSTVSWITWFHHLKGNEYFCPVDEAFLFDKFNLTGLPLDTPLFRKAYDIIIDEYGIDFITQRFLDEDDSDERLELDKAACHIYGLIHARFILTSAGLAKMNEKYAKAEFGTCPRFFCQNHKLLPVGLTDIPAKSGVKLFCCSCNDVYNPKSLKHNAIDGSYFGTTFPHLFVKTYPAAAPDPATPLKKYEPKIFGFKITSDKNKPSS